MTDTSPGQPLTPCLTDGRFLRSVQHILLAAQEQVDALALRCLGGGGCCKFDLAGHRLYVSIGELALLTADGPPRPNRDLPPLRCPYQCGPRCTARRSRPLGCRTHFCDPSHDDTLAAIYEAHHARIRRLHDRFAKPYAYVELTAALASMSK